MTNFSLILSSFFCYFLLYVFQVQWIYSSFFCQYKCPLLLLCFHGLNRLNGFSLVSVSGQMTNFSLFLFFHDVLHSFYEYGNDKLLSFSFIIFVQYFFSYFRLNSFRVFFFPVRANGRSFSLSSIRVNGFSFRPLKWHQFFVSVSRPQLFIVNASSNIRINTVIKIVSRH